MAEDVVYIFTKVVLWSVLIVTVMADPLPPIRPQTARERLTRLVSLETVEPHFIDDKQVPESGTIDHPFHGCRWEDRGKGFSP